MSSILERAYDEWIKKHYPIYYHSIAGGGLLVILGTVVTILLLIFEIDIWRTVGLSTLLLLIVLKIAVAIASHYFAIEIKEGKKKL